MSIRDAHKAFLEQAYFESNAEDGKPAKKPRMK